MNVSRLAIHGLLAAMMGAPFLQSVERLLEASPTAPPAFQRDLLLNRPIAPPALDRLAKLDRLVIARYVVRPNEDIWSICRRFGLKDFAFTIRSSNDLDESPAPGTVLRIPNRIGTIYDVRSPQTLNAVASGFQAGRIGGSAYERDVLALNDFPMPDLRMEDHPLKAGTALFLPSAYKPTGLPIPFKMGQSYRITSRFGRRSHPVLGVARAHKGLDLARPYGSPVYPSRDGVVTFAGWMGGYGNMIEIRHLLRSGRIRYTRYGHLSAIGVHEGQRVGASRVIGRVGSTGISTGPHLHFEVRDETGQARNPARTL